MKKTIRLLPAALAVISAGLFAACDDDSDKLDNPLTTLHATGWTFSPAECQEACIGEIRTRDDEPQINAYSDNEDVEVTVAKMAGKDDGMFVYKVLVSLQERTAPRSPGNTPSPRKENLIRKTANTRSRTPNPQCSSSLPTAK